MHRIDTPTAQKDKFGAGKNGFTRGNPQTGTPATDLDDDFFDMLQEELAKIVEGAGIQLDKTKRDQLSVALPVFLGLKTASKRDVGTGPNQIPDMSSFSKGAGYFKLPNGKIIQWVQGTTNTSAAAQVNYPIPFPSGATSVIASPVDVNVPNWVAANIYQPGSCLVSAWDSSKVRAATGVMIIAIGE